MPTDTINRIKSIPILISIIDNLVWNSLLRERIHIKWPRGITILVLNLTLKLSFLIIFEI